jgi:hypothetical protein
MNVIQSSTSNPFALACARNEGVRRWAAAAILVASLLCSVGCNRPRIPLVTLHGTVTCGGQKVDTGRIVFVPIEGTPGPASVAEITDGQYTIKSRGGVPVGKHRVEVIAMKYTGRETQQRTMAGDQVAAPEKTNIGPEKYAGAQSPLVIEIPANTDGQIDIEIPAK